MLSCRRTTLHKSMSTLALVYCVEEQTGGPTRWDRLLPCVAAEMPSRIVLRPPHCPQTGPCGSA